MDFPVDIKPLGFNLILLVDVSYSMFFPEPSSYLTLSKAIKELLKDDTFNNGRIALFFFPQERNQWKVESYQTPVFPLTQLPAPQLQNKLDRKFTNGHTTSLPAVLGAYSYVDSEMAKAPKEKFILLLVTDGVPTTTNDPTKQNSYSFKGFSSLKNDVNGLKQVVGRLNQQSPSILTHVIGLGDVGELGRLSVLNDIAAAGGTGCALLVNKKNPKEISEQFRETIKKVQAEAWEGVFLIPPPPQGHVYNYDSMSMVYQPKGGEPILLPRGDHNGEGWDFCEGFQKIMLFPKTSALIRDNKGSIRCKQTCYREGHTR
ncbi:vWA domain-containing protein [Pajaroellobacter abortibovis]|nr:vWA domain-containing protein [Pajaroellobacter abortibovis]